MTQANENLNDKLDHELTQIYNLIMERLQVMKNLNLKVCKING